MRRRTIFKLLGGAGAATFLASCGDGGGGAARVLTVGLPNGALTENHNPFMPDSAANKLGYRWLIYEPLAQVNMIAPDSDPTPWLATAWTWNEDYTSIELTIRNDITWTDGKPLTPDDVAFTFNLLRDNDALNTEALPFVEATAAGDVVTVGFETPQFINQGKVLASMVLPQHVWAAMDDPSTDINLDPVGSGPYVLKSWTTQVVTLEPNTEYWGGKPEIPEIRFTSYNDNNAQTTALANGECQWSYVFIPDYQKIYIDKDPQNHHLWFPSGLGIHGLWINHARPPFDNLALRRAMNMVIDRVMVHEIGESGLYPLVDNLTGIPRPAGDAFIAPEYRDATHQVDVDGARSILEEADFDWDADGNLLTPDGDPVTMVLCDPAGWSDYLASLAIIADNLKVIGIQATVDALEPDVWFDAIAVGDFDGMLHWTATGVTPYEIFANCMDQAYYKELGESASWNFGRFDSPEATEALRDYAATVDDEVRDKAMATLQRIMVEEVPMIPLVAGPIGAQYSTKHWVGWPSEDDPYAMPQPTQPSMSQIVMRLKPA
ncbi:peptide/nickel transport system substrate-binding protein [Stackebrandtia endophytica]|uniref:Peptide/nickel transport system substrate-binding protein n=1 Tax=Stackebrandtia endophytica TaxID=1496996 RepID=A0A543AQE7_9ACTN|nr:ABC transporter substrate-binding protein [Stackebrandtia endophytica]TQL74784.1 peptide/nickel transport system substrate-binding protein [Stackebrandtia endophytica]